MEITRNDKFKIIDMIAMSLIVVGGLNWGLVGFFGFDLVAFLFGEMAIVSRIIYTLVGISAIYHLSTFRATQRRWECNTQLESVSTTSSG